MTSSERGRPPARERILESAYALFTHRRVSDVGVNEVIARAGVSKATFYDHFPSKDSLVLEYLDLRERRATLEWLDAGARERTADPEGRLLAIFDLLAEWFAEEDFAGCPFINVLLEFGPGHTSGAASVRHLHTMRGVVERLAREAGLGEPDAFAAAFHMLIKGACVSAAERDPLAAATARAMAGALIERHRPVAAA